MKRIILVVLVVTMVMTSLYTMAGCKTNTSTETPAKTQTDTPKKVSLRFLDVSPSPTRETFFKDVISDFEKNNEGIKLRYESVPWDDAANKIATMGAGKNIPDVLVCYPGWLQQIVPSGWIIPLNDYLDGSDVKDKFNAFVRGSHWATEEQNFGKIYTIPDGLVSKGVFIRKDWAEEKGIKLNPDWTWDEYFDVIHQLTDPNLNRYGMSLRGGIGAFDRFADYLKNFTGGEMYDDDGNCLLYSPEMVKHFEKWCSVYFNGDTPKDAINWGFVEMVDNFTSGLTGTVLNDPEVIVMCQEQMSDDQWTVLKQPKSDVDGISYDQPACVYPYSISANSKNPDEAWNFIEFISNAENNMKYCKELMFIPVRTDLAGDPFFSEEGPMGGFVKAVNNPNLVIPASAGPIDTTDMRQGMLHVEIQKYMLGEQTSDQALKKISDEFGKRMKEYMAKNPGTKVPKPIKMIFD